jgi:predicted anti-sigma-YlaC factor YlaD
MSVGILQRPGASAFRLATVLCLLLLLPACSIKRMAVKTMADALSEGASSYSTDEDPELVRDALPFGLKTLEGLLPTVPRHRGLLRSLASGFTSYAVAFILPDARALESVDLERSREEQTRARKMLLRARDYGLRSLDVGYPNFSAQLLKDPAAAVQRTKKEDIPDLYWTAAAWGMAISSGKDQVELLGDTPLVEALIMRALALDETWDDGSIHEFLIAFESRGEAAGGSYKRARQHFERAVELAHGTKIGPYVSMAESVSVQEGNRAEFEQLLDKALAYDPNSHIETRLVNILAQRRARQLKAQIDDLFLTRPKP